MRSRLGYNLVEIAIVLAVIALVIGGIYIAAGAVMENMRKEATQKQMLQIVMNVRTMWANQATFSVPTYQQIRDLHLFPPDLVDTGSGFIGEYGAMALLYYPPSANSDLYFGISFQGLSQKACLEVWMMAGSASSVQQLGIYDIGNQFAGLGHSNVVDGVSPAEAVQMCPLQIGNWADFEFALR